MTAQIPLNPGFILLIAGFLVMAAPRIARTPITAGSALLALWLLLEHRFGAREAIEQMNLPVVLLNLDPLNRIFGIAMLIALIAIAMYAGARRNRYEDAATLVLAGAAVSALFVGDLVSFVASMALAGLGAAWLVFCSPVEGSARAGARLLVWNGLESLLLLVGVAFHLAGGGRESLSGRMDAGTIGGACIFVALLMRVGAPLAHVWVKDTIAHASPSGAAALSAFASMIGVYAVARLFPAEPLLIFIGAAMIVIGALYAAAADDLRAAAAYALLTQIGICLALIGVGSPLALAAAEGHAFTSIIAFAALQMALGAVVYRAGEVRVSRLAGLSQFMPIACGLLLAAGLTAAGMPALAMYASLSVGLEAASAWDLRWLWLLMCANSAALFVSLVLRPQFAAHSRSKQALALMEAPFPMVLGTVVAVFYCVSIGVAPGWLYALMPAELTFAPFAWDRVAPQLEMLGAAGVVYVLLHALRLLPREEPQALLDMDALYRGPVTSAGRWGGVVLLRLYGTWRAGLGVLAERVGAALAAWTRSCDRPYLGRSWAALQFWLICAMVVVILVGARL